MSPLTANDELKGGYMDRATLYGKRRLGRVGSARTRFFGIVTASLMMLAGFNASPAFAVPQLRLVTNTNDNGAGSLRQAILDANAINTGDTIVFQSGLTGTITLTSGSLVIENSMTINGPGAAVLAISGDNISQVFVVDTSATVSISGLTVESGNSPSGSGGGIENFGALTVTDSSVSNNTAKFGGGISSSGTLTLINCTVFQNNSTKFVGGIDIAGIATLTNLTVSGNIAVGEGGGIEIESNATATLANSTVSGNMSEAAGGIENSGTLTAINSTIAGNTATTAQGGGIGNFGTLTLTNSTVSDNSAPPNQGGGISNGSTSLTRLKNTIVANNPLGGNCAGTGGTFFSNGYNLSDDTTCSSLLIGTGDINNTPAGLDPAGLQDNGGPNQTIALLAGGAAVDAVPVSPTNFCLSVATDQRGVVRPQGAACDIGAFELMPSPVSVTLKIAPKALKFPKTAIGTQSKPRRVKVSNPKGSKKHPGFPVVIEMISDPGEFTETNDCPADLAAGMDCSISVTFTPSAATKQTGTLTITDNASGGTQTVPMSGTGK